jgi:excisionase family DNA binding protein
MNETVATPERQTLNLEQARRVLGIGRSTIYRAANNGNLPVIRVGKRWLMSKVALEQILQGEMRSEKGVPVK